MLGFDMLAEGFGFDPKVLQANVNSAIAHVQNIDARIGNVEKVLLLVHQSNQEIQNVCNENFRVSLRIEDAIDALNRDAANNTVHFVEDFETANPDAAAQMNAQLGETDKPIIDSPLQLVNGKAQDAGTDATQSATTNTTDDTTGNTSN